MRINYRNNWASFREHLALEAVSRVLDHQDYEDGYIPDYDMYILALCVIEYPYARKVDDTMKHSMRRKNTKEDYYNLIKE